ncbi:MAG: OsmC family protein [Chloroflexi bacterium]|nr:OsmC family protein [Chloroflexota bacterium]MCL5107754.1 OsmC family protein [Chloroflexota bacterium]
MAEDSEITVGYRREGEDIHHLLLGSDAVEDIRIDYSGIPSDQRGGTASKLLCAAALYCFASTLASALNARGARIESLTARAVARKGRDDYYRTKLQDIRIEVDVDLDQEDLPILEKCDKIMQRGCLITYSLTEGIEVEHAIRLSEPAESGTRVA